MTEKEYEYLKSEVYDNIDKLRKILTNYKYIEIKQDILNAICCIQILWNEFENKDFNPLEN